MRKQKIKRKKLKNIKQIKSKVNKSRRKLNWAEKWVKKLEKEVNGLKK